MKILSLETSCDETAAAVIEADEKGYFKVLADVVSSQVKIHAPWGGVVPNLAAREHLKNIVPVMNEALEKAKINLDDVDYFTATKGPGLIPALLLGTNSVKTLSYFSGKPLLGVHHVEGHIYSNFSDGKKGDLNKFEFPLLALVVSGGHTQLVLMKNHLQYEIIGQTQDDAAGEAFDKVAKILQLGYPGGSIVSRRAKNAEEQLEKIENENLREKLLEINFPRPMLNRPDFDFSFSGLKTAVLYFYQNLQDKIKDAEESELWKDFICRDFQNAVVEVLTKKTIKAAKKYNPKNILLAGGVAANEMLRETLRSKVKEELKNVGFDNPPINLCGDNAVMSATAAYCRILKMKEAGRLDELKFQWRDLEADANFKLENFK